MQLDVTKFSDEVKYQGLGKLSPDIINFIVSKKPDFKDRISSEKEILFWKSRVRHTERHRKDFDNDVFFENQSAHSRDFSRELADKEKFR